MLLLRKPNCFQLHTGHFKKSRRTFSYSSTKSYISKQLREKLPAKHNAELYLVCAMNSLILLTASVNSRYDFTNP